MRTNRTKTVTIATILLIAAVVATALVVGTTHRDEPVDRRDPGARTGGRTSVDLLTRITDYTARFAPGTGYRPPTRNERLTAASGLRLLLAGHADQAKERLSGIDLSLDTVTDSSTGRRYAEIADRTEQGRAPRGWGRVYVETGSPARWSVQVPHPVADRNTERLAVGVLRGGHGGVLVIAGAHRKAGAGDAADVAHRRDSVFDAFCDELAERGLPGLQIHGFADDSAPGRDVIASTGRGREGRADGRLLADELRARDFDVCRAWVRSCPLEGHTNVQGAKAAAEHVPFLHVEFANALRTDAPRTAHAVEAMRRVTAAWEKGGTS
ncbi:hypothetical protein ACIHCV_00840 [Streptomyces sp. NPDC051956]|uniref:hypothetical protein n=1 Tax=Streptomyces sp. NPDC051956 TaxID=3365677 RepID=UPI0037D29E26